LVLDNPETFLNVDVPEETSRIKNEIAELGRLSSVSLLPLCGKSRRPQLGSTVCGSCFHESLLTRACRSAVASHPRLHFVCRRVSPSLAINLASAAEENGWLIVQLNDRWMAQQTNVLSPGQGKDDSLPHSMELS